MDEQGFKGVLRGKYPAKQHAQRVVQLLQEKIPNAKGYLYLEGQNTRFLEDSDSEEPFRQRSHFFYLTGCNLHDCYFLYDLQLGESTLFIPPVDPEEVVWCGLPTSIDEALARYDVDHVRYSSDLPSILANLPQSDGFTFFAIANQTSTPLTHKHVDTESLKPTIEQSRVIKDEYEIALIRKANAISSKGHHEVMQRARAASTETQLEATFLHHCVAHSAKKMAYAPIFASGRAAATLHYEANDKPLAGKLNMLVDAGAKWENYASDITRTFPLSGTFTPESLQIYNLVLTMQDTCISRLKAGVNWDAMHLLAHEIAIAGLLQLGILRGEPTTLLASRVSLAFFPHGLGHYLGLDVHDVGGNATTEKADTDPMFRYLRTRGILPAGCVVTVEPGIYFCEYLLRPYLEDPKYSRYIDAAVLERYWDVGGVRIEDNVLVTETGYENLTAAVKTAEDIQALMDA